MLSFIEALYYMAPHAHTHHHVSPIDQNSFFFYNPPCSDRTQISAQVHLDKLVPKITHCMTKREREGDDTG